MTGRIFISYRRNDSQYATDRIYERLAAHFGVGGVFMDIDDIPMGVNFRDYIDEQIGTSDIVIAIIGDHWLNARDQDGNLRLQNPNDFVRLEIEAAIKQNIRLIPVFIGGVQSLPEKKLPDSLKPLNLINATRIRRSKDFLPDVDKLIKGIEKIHAHQTRTRIKNQKYLSGLNSSIEETIEQSHLFEKLTLDEETEIREILEEFQKVSSSLKTILSDEELQLRLDLNTYEKNTNHVISRWNEFKRKVYQRLSIEEANRSQQEKQEEKKRTENLTAIESIERSLQDTQSEMKEVSDLTIEERRLQVRLNREIQFALRSLNRIKESPARLLLVELDEHEEKVDQIQNEWLELITAIDTRKLDEQEKLKQKEKEQETLLKLNEEKLKHEREQKEQRERERKQKVENKTKRISDLQERFSTTLRQLEQIPELTTAEKRTQTEIIEQIQQEINTLQQVLVSPDEILQLNLKEIESHYDQLVSETDEFSHTVSARVVDKKSKQDSKQAAKLKPTQQEEPIPVERSNVVLEQIKEEEPIKEVESSIQAIFSKVPLWGWIVGGVLILTALIFGGIAALGSKDAVAQNDLGTTTTPAFLTTNTPTDKVTPVIAQTPTITLTHTQTTTPEPSPTATYVPTAEPIGIKTNLKDNASMVLIPAGEFQMGSEEFEYSMPIHTVYTDDFWMYQYEVTNEMFAAFLEDVDAEDGQYYWQHDETALYRPIRILSGEWKAYGSIKNHPAGVSWIGASYYCAWAGGRLPTEAEWEKAARGGLEGMTYPWGNEEPIDDRNAVNGIYALSISFGGPILGTKAVGLYYPNGYGLYNMADNALEWTSSNAYDYPYEYTKAEEGEKLWGYFNRNSLDRIQRGGGSEVGKIGYRVAVVVTMSHEDLSGFRCVYPSDPSTAFYIEPTPTPQSGASMTREKDEMEMVYVPAGTFTMGSEDGNIDEAPTHEVYLDAFWVDKFEVTNTQYDKCVSDGACDEGNNPYDSVEDANRPRTHVSWYQADAYCQWVGGSLPTEAQWEKAARGTDGRMYPWGDEEPTCELAVFGFDDGTCEAEDIRVVGGLPIGSYQNNASPYGAVDMAGNLSEWVSDWYGSTYYSNSPSENPTGPAYGESRVVRGGSWSNNAAELRTTVRFSDDPNFSEHLNGFRCVISVEP